MIGFLVNSILGTCEVLAIAALGTGLWAATLGQDSFWIFDLCAHFMAQWLAGFLLLAAWLAFRKRWAVMTLALVGVALASIEMSPFLTPSLFPPTKRSEKHASSATLHVMQANVFAFNLQPHRVFEEIKTSQPDIIALEEITPQWRDRLKAADYAGYSTHAIAYYGQNVLLSKFPLIWSRTIQVPHGYFSDEYLVARVLAKLSPKTPFLHVVIVHPPRPTNPKNVHMQRQYLTHLSSTIQDLKTRWPDIPLILMGDFNATPWSVPYRQLSNQLPPTLRNTLLDTRPYQPTWPTIFPLVGMPIDHIWWDPGNSGLSLQRRRNGGWTGSDHAAVHAWFE
jgi:endonuclease/exonuclease/phosphatase (EEP) superfamily protein YafD